MKNRRHRSIWAVVALLGAGCPTTDPTAAWAAEPAKVVIKGFLYTPMSLTVKAGTSVTWVNMDDEPHTVVSSTGMFRSGGIDTNESYSFKFDKPGTYGILCSLHPRMVATIEVE